MQGPSSNDSGDARPPLDRSDKALATIDNDLLKPETRAALHAQGLTSASIADDHSGDQAEACTRTVLEREGIPDGSGGMEPVKRVVPGTHDRKHGIDLIAVTQDGQPAPIEVKKRLDASSAALEDKPVSKDALEPEVQRAKQERERQLQLYRDGKRSQLRPDHAATWKPEVAQWQRTMETDLARSRPDEQGVPRLSVEQMDDLWVKDRYLKLLRTDGGPERLQTAGVDPKYCQIENFVDSHGSLTDTSLWDDILSQRTTVIVSPADDPAGKVLFDQAVFENRSRRVLKIGL